MPSRAQATTALVGVAISSEAKSASAKETSW
jgi:hypothetical protein